MTGSCSIRFAIVAPTFNNAGKLLDVLHRLARTGMPLIVVNDGSTDATASLLEDLGKTEAGANITVLRHARHRGRGMALQAGFKAARAAGYTHALAIDTTGEFEPEQIPEMLATSMADPVALVIGVREECASRGRFGRRISNLLVRVECGLKVQDSQCGMRIYPLEFICSTRCITRGDGFETETITRAGWAGCPVVEVPVRWRGLPDEQRASGLRPVLDSLIAGVIHARLLARALSPWPHTPWPARNQPALPTWKTLANWANPREAWRQLKRDEAGRTMFAVGLGMGAFIANLPAYGIQTLLAIYAARKLHMHPVPVVLGTQISMPPMGVGLIILAVYVGHVILHGMPPVIPTGEVTMGSVAAMAPSMLLSWVVGSVIVGVVSAVLIFLGALLLFRIALPRQAAK